MVKKLLNRDITKLSIGTFLSQVISLLSAPLLSRYYGPEAFGVSAIFFSIIGLLSVIVCLRYENAIVVATEKESIYLLIISILSSVIVSFFIFLVIVILKPFFLDFFDKKGIVNFIFFIPMFLLLSGLYNSFNSWFIRKRNFSHISIGNISNQVTTTSYSLLTGAFFMIRSSNLIIASFLGQLVINIVFIFKFITSDLKLIKQKITTAELFESIVRYKNFPLYSSFGSIINSASWQLPVMAMGYFFSVNVVGFYSLGFRLLQLPMSIIGASIGQVFFQKGAAFENNKLTNLVKSTFRKLFIISIIPTIILTFISGDLFQFVFGVKWREAGVYVQILAPWAFFWFISSPLAWIYTIKEKQKEELYIHVLIFIVRLISIIIGGYFLSPRNTMILFSISGILIYSYLLHKIFIYSNIKIVELLAFVKQILLLIIVFVFLLVSITFFYKLHILLVIIYCLASFALFMYSNKRILLN